MRTLNEQLELIKNALSIGYSLDITDYVDVEDILENRLLTDDFFDTILENGINTQEVIYYSEAMEYLRIHDVSLKDSLWLAGDAGYETKDINSELLATLLYRDNLVSEIYSRKDEIDERLQEVYDKLDEEYESEQEEV